MAERLHAGFGKARLKDPVGLEMAGYGYFLNRRCTGVMDHLHVHCVALRFRRHSTAQFARRSKMKSSFFLPLTSARGSNRSASTG